MTSPKVVVKIQGDYSLNNVDRKTKNVNKINNATTNMFDYYGNEEKRLLNMFDYYNGTLTKDNYVNIMLENGKYATKEDIEKRKIQYLKYIENSNIWKCVISFNNDYLEKNIHYEKLEKALMKEILPMFFKKIGFIDINNMSYQIALHSDTDNLHYHFSFIEKKPNFKYIDKVGYRRKLKINENDINFLKNQIVHYIEKEKIYTSLLKETNKDIDKLKKYFDNKEKCFVLKNKNDLILENKIYELGKLLYNSNKISDNKIKYNSLKSKEIKNLTREIKKYIFGTNKNISQDYKVFNHNLNKINDYFIEISKDNNIKDYINSNLVLSKKNYINNYILNSIVNYANYKYKNVKEQDILQKIILDKYKNNKMKNRYSILKSYLSNNVLINKKEIDYTLRKLNYEMQECIKEFDKMFNYEKDREI